jgi:hypothetical protein
MTETLTVTLNNQLVEVPNTVETVSEFRDAVGVTHNYYLYRIDGGEEAGPLGNGLMVFDEGDEFVAIPKYVIGG